MIVLSLFSGRILLYRESSLDLNRYAKSFDYIIPYIVTVFSLPNQLCSLFLKTANVIHHSVGK